MKHAKAKTGDFGEEAAQKFLIGLGFKILATKYARKFGEVDIIVQKDRVIHFVEVKTSIYVPDSDFRPEIRVDKRKIANLQKICNTYLLDINAPGDQKWQIDVISVILNRDYSTRTIEHFENAVFEQIY